MKHAAILGLFGVVLGIAPTSAQPAAPQRACFLIDQFRGWKAPDARTIFIRVGLDLIYRLDLATSCPLLAMPEVHLITKTRGPDLVCSAIDWDLSVAEPPPASMPEPCIVKQMTLLTPVEAAAIPPKFRP
jgi:hypothetical protein